jgi:hypothetical protein
MDLKIFENHEHPRTRKSEGPNPVDSEHRWKPWWQYLDWMAPTSQQPPGYWLDIAPFITKNDKICFVNTLTLSF